jgi:hypothetical protein
VKLVANTCTTCFTLQSALLHVRAGNRQVYRKKHSVSIFFLCLFLIFGTDHHLLANTSGTSFNYGIFDIFSKDIVMKDTSGLILKIMQSQPEFFKKYIDSADGFEIQIIYTQINRDKVNNPHFRQFSYRLNDKAYFCPASTSKLPVSLLALEKVNGLKEKGINKYTPMRFDSAWTCQKAAVKDTISPDSILSVAHYIQKIMIVSNNDAYNRLYEFLGQKHINRKLHRMGFRKTSIIQRFSSCNPEENRYTNPMMFLDSTGRILYSQPLIVNRKVLKNPLGTIIKGKGYIDDSSRLVEVPRDFTFYNNVPLQDLHEIMLRVVFPKSFPERKRFKLQEDDYRMLYRYMSMYPRESEFPKYHDSIRFPDNRKKYLMYGADTCRYINDSTLRIINIVGQMSGYLTDCAYIVDFKNNTEFVLAATIYNCQSGIFDYAYYRYKEVGFPFLQELGKAVYQYELSRKKEYPPDLLYMKKCIETPLNNKDQ